jgi:ABC-type lipoprotein release transport system permease subunit
VKSAHLSLVGFAAASLRRRRARTVTLVLGLASSVALLSAVSFLTGALRVEATRVREAMPALVVQRLVAGRPALLDPALAPVLERIAAVRSVQPRVWGYLFLASIQSNVAIVGSSARGPITLAEGHDLGPDGRGAVLLGKELAEVLGVRVGDHVMFPRPNHTSKDLVVAGVFSASTSLYTSDVALVHEDDAREILGVPAGSAVDFAVELTNPDESQVAARKASEAFAGARVIERRQLDRTLALVYGRRAGFVLGGSLPALLALFVLAWDRAAGVGPAERREIAVLKASGWSTGDVLRLKLYESLVVGLAGAGLGIVLAYVWCFALGAPGLREILAGWAVLYPRARLTPAVDGAAVLSVLALVIAPFVALSIGPAWRAAGVDPLDAMREG